MFGQLFHLFFSLSCIHRIRRTFDDDDPKLELDKLPIADLLEIYKREEVYFEAIGSLHELSFVRQSLEIDDVVSIHPVIHQWSIEHTRQLGCRENLMAAVASMLANAIPRTSFKSRGLPYDRLQPHYDHWYSLCKVEDSLVSRVGCKPFWELIKFRFTQAAHEETIPLVQIAAANALARHGWSHAHTILLQFCLANVYRKSSQTCQKGADLFEKLAPYALNMRLMPEMTVEDDRAIVESSINYHRFLINKPADSQNVLLAHGHPGNRDLVSSILRRNEEICDSSRNLYSYPYLRRLQFVMRWQHLRYEDPNATDEDIEMIQRVLNMVEHGKLGRHPFSPPPYSIRILQAGLALCRGTSYELANLKRGRGTLIVPTGETNRASHAMEDLFTKVLATEGTSSLALLQIEVTIMATKPSCFFEVFLGNASSARHWGAALDLAHIRVLWQRRRDQGCYRVSERGDPERSFQAFRRWQMLLTRVREVVRRSREARAKSMD